VDEAKVSLVAVQRPPRKAAEASDERKCLLVKGISWELKAWMGEV
jgi:hypothetical protein